MVVLRARVRFAKFVRAFTRGTYTVFPESRIPSHSVMVDKEDKREGNQEAQALLRMFLVRQSL
jgi:hypothetical protein